MRRVALVTNGARSVTNFRGQLVAELRGRGLAVSALAPDWTDAERARARALGAEPVDVALERTGTNPLADAAYLARLVAALRRLSPDAVLTYFAKPNIYGMIAARLAGAPRRVAMVEGLGSVFDASLPPTFKRRALQAVTRTLYRTAFAAADRVLFLNAEDQRFFVEGGLVRADKAVAFGGIGVDLTAFAPAPPVTDPVSFVMMARLLRAKGPLVFAQAARLVRREAPGARFVLLGGVDANPDTIDAEELAPFVADGSITWPGHVDDVRGALAAASVFVLPSWYAEGLPRSSQEAAAMAKPIVTTDSVGCRDTVEAGRSGFLVPPRDPDALAAALLRFVREPELIAIMGRESRRIAEERWDGARKAGELADLIVGTRSR